MAAYPNRLGSQVSGRLTSQRACHAPAASNAGCVFPYADLPGKVGSCRSCMFVRFPPIKSELREQGEGCDPAGSERAWPLASRKGKSYALGLESEYDDWANGGRSN